MGFKFSKNKIEAFVGEVFAVYLVSDDGSVPCGVKWSASQNGLNVRVFDKDERYGTEQGILAVATKAARYEIRALLGGEEYVCEVLAKEMKSYDGSAPLNYYRGDMHVHTSMDHNHDSFPDRIGEAPYDMLKAVKEEGTLDFTVISDHGDVLCDKEFLRAFTDAELIQPLDTVVFPGSESEANVYVTDRFGTNHKHSGEVVMINTLGYSGSVEWDGFLADHADSPLPVGVFAHPQVVGSDGSSGLWNNDYQKIYGGGLERFIRLVEIGNGEDRAENLLHEYSYSDALDAGFKVSVSCGSDTHGPVFGSKACSGKTVIMATEKTKEALLDALLENRAYATESGNVKLSYSVNGKTAPTTLDETSLYNFDVDISYFESDPDSEILECQVVSDYAERIYSTDCKGKSSLSFSISSNSARYFYLRLVDRLGRKTWSMPVWTGRAFDKYKEDAKELIPKEDYELTDRNGNDLSILKNTDIWRDHIFENKSEEIVVRLKEEGTVSAIGLTHKKLSWSDLRKKGEETSDYTRGYVSKYRISVSADGENYEVVRHGLIKVFGDEVILDFPPKKVKYVKFEALSTVGFESDFPKYMNAKVRIANISLY